MPKRKGSGANREESRAINKAKRTFRSTASSDAKHKRQVKKARRRGV